MRTLVLAALASVVSSAAMADAVTTRIETRPYYGAIVTIEQGVRVWRALPPHDRIIINPDGKTPLNLSFQQTQQKVVNQHTSVNVQESGPAVFGGGVIGDGGHRGHPRHHGGGYHAPRTGIISVPGGHHRGH